MACMRSFLAYRLAPLCLALVLPAAASAQIVRCAGSDGRVTYQQIPCADGNEQKVGIPSDYPPPNTAERERLLAREAAVDRRLEAERDRWQQDAALRVAREEREAERARLAAIETQSQQQYAVAYPYWRPHPTPYARNAATRPGQPTQPIWR
jgi:hypothetical protein